MIDSHPAETLTIEGPDAVAFAHAQFSSNVKSLAADEWEFSAWLNSQGRVLALFHLIRMSDNALLLLLRGGSAMSMVNALRRFVFRSKVILTAHPVRTLSTGDAMTMHATRNENDVVALGCGDHSLLIDSASNGDGEWRTKQWRDGWAWLPKSALNEVLPSALSLQRLRAVVIDKGCYPGQEIVARMHFRGGHKRHMHSVVLSQPITNGEVLRVDERDVGHVLDVVTSNDEVQALVVLNDEFVTQHADNQLTSFDNKVVMQLRASWPA
ncbi:folate-binding protein [Rhodanobacter sp. L36]|uniref:CAF17-like 4Fe-4S cluster assembly/insertion protein YgfZ n=1 Tax=Rhodanobacter sp. L36 TaxID=1747221 RepID=UPI00131AEA0B|nr:folate-binding protein [Rhodanobacter sp. L36]